MGVIRWPALSAQRDGAMFAVKMEEPKEMKPITKRVILLLALSFVVGTVALAEQTAFPVKVSENKRYFVDQSGKPVFWLGTTQWQLFREYKLEEARTILEKTSSHGFVFVQVMLMGVGDGTAPNVYGQKPWINDDPLTPNEAYFKNVDAVVRIARENNLAISMTLYHQRYRKHITHGERPAVGEVAGRAVQGRAQHRLVDDARGASRSSCRSCGSWRRGCARATAAATSSPSSPTPRRTPPASSTPSPGWTSTRCRPGTASS